MKRSILAALGAASILFTGAVEARAPSQADANHTAIRDFAGCLTATSGGWRDRQIDRFLALAPESKAAGRLMAMFLNTDCMAVPDPGRYAAQIGLTPQLLRGALYRERYVARFGGRPIGTLAGYNAGAAWYAAPSGRFAPLQSFGECVVRMNPQGARAVVLSDVGSTEERAAYRMLRPAMARCIRPGDKIRFSKSVLEGLFAEALYHLSIGAGAGAPAGGF